MPVSKRRKPRPHATPKKAGIEYRSMWSDDECEQYILSAVPGDVESEMDAVCGMACMAITRLDNYSSHDIAPVEGAGWQGPYEAWFEPNDAALTDAFVTGYGRALYGLMHAPFLEMGKKYRQTHPIHHQSCWDNSITKQYPSHAEGWLLKPEVLWALDANKSGIRLQIEVAPNQGTWGRQSRRYYPAVSQVAAKMLCMMLVAVEGLTPEELRGKSEQIRLDHLIAFPEPHPPVIES